MKYIYNVLCVLIYVAYGAIRITMGSQFFINIWFEIGAIIFAPYLFLTVFSRSKDWLSFMLFFPLSLVVNVSSYLLSQVVFGLPINKCSQLIAECSPKFNTIEIYVILYPVLAILTIVYFRLKFNGKF